jgi:Mitochondrial biogenesis AIM24
MLKPTNAVLGYRLLVRQRRRIVLPLQRQQWHIHAASARAFSSSVAHTNNSHTSSPLVPNDENSNNNLPAKLIDFQIAAKIEGDESHVATIELQPGETLRAESGAMLFMTEGIVSKYFIS